MKLTVAQLPSPRNADHWRNRDALVEAVAKAIAEDDLIVVVESPRAREITAGRGQFLPLRGICAHRTRRVRGVEFEIGALRVPVKVRQVRDEVRQTLQDAGFADCARAGFGGRLLITDPDTPKELACRIRVELDDGQSQAVELEPVHVGADSVASTVSGQSAVRVAIAMATYEPDAAGFRRQIESIRAQTVADWHLTIVDDASSCEARAVIREVVANDARIDVHYAEDNLGFYGNFERALRAVPNDAQYIALADQDDSWYPEKLQRLIEAMPANGQLCYSDMRIVDQNNAVISDTYWRGRNNNHSDLDVVLLANTVTGAASLMRAELRASLLPFPERVGDAFHDHWIALSAMCRGPVGYVDAPLYDYIQHDSAVIGHSDFATPSAGTRIRRLLAMPFKASFWRNIPAKLQAIRRGALNIHRYECQRLELIRHTLIARCPGMSAARMKTLALFDGGLPSAVRLLLKHPAIVFRGASTNDAELRLAMGYLVHAVDPLCLWVAGRAGGRR